MNYLLHGLGAKQTWIADAEPWTLLDRYKEQGPYLHGNPYQTRRVVLSKELLDTGEITPVTVVEPGQVIDRFLQEAKRASEQAKKDNGHVLLMPLCHGEKDLEYALQLNGPTEKGLTIARLKGVLEPGARVTLLTTACYSGGSAMTSELNRTALTVANHRDTSPAWKHAYETWQQNGTIFIGTVIRALSSTGSPLVDPDTWSLHPDDPTDRQAETFNAFCEAVHEICRAKVPRLGDWMRGFSVAAYNDGRVDSWTRRTGVRVAGFRARWDRLVEVPYTGPADVRRTENADPSNPFLRGAPSCGGSGSGSSSSTAKHADETLHRMAAARAHGRATEMAQLFLDTCPGDWERGQNVSLGSKLYGFVEGRKPWDDEENLTAEDVISTIDYRWNACLHADTILEDSGLAPPGGAPMCVLWDTWSGPVPADLAGWREWNRLKHLLHDIFSKWPDASRERLQGPPFIRPEKYVVAALMESGLSEAAVVEKARAIQAYLMDIGQALQDRVVGTESFREKVAAYLGSIGLELSIQKDERELTA